jgi:hypothetical protein
MNNNKRILLEKYVRVAIKKAIQEQEAAQKRAEKSMYLISSFPGLKKLMEDLMSPSFGRFVTDMKLVAPKPTTFSAKLINEQEFNIIYNGKGKFTVKVVYCISCYLLHNKTCSIFSVFCIIDPSLFNIVFHQSLP